MSATRNGLALASAATLVSLSCGALVGAASADPGGVPHHGNNGQHHGQVKHGDKHGDKPKGKDKNKDKDKSNNGQHHGHGNENGKSNGKSNGKGNGNGNPQAPGQQGSGAAAPGDPAGNNGTVKIAAPSDAVGHPSNNPHPGCTVVVEWFGFDAGDDVVSTVSFAPQAPTSDAVIGGADPSSVFVGGDAASGGTDLDGRQAYTLTFQGEPHPKQGFHVKLTVATPHSLGNDTKSKVFWVEPCATAPTATDASEAPKDTTQQGASSHSLTAPSQPGSPERGVGGTSTSVDELEGTTAVAEREDADALVPTAVDAGEDSSVLPDWARSPLPLAVVAGGLVLVGVGIARRAQNGA